MSEDLYPLTPGRHSEALARSHAERVRQILHSHPQLRPEPLLLTAWLTPLRQALGSCFATAPAIRIQQEDPERFLRDLVELTETHQLKRIISGVEYSVPICPADQPLLRRWEYTLASFTETKANFSRWNLYTSLGFDPSAVAGLGALIQQLIQGQLDRANLRTQALESQIAALRARQIEARQLEAQLKSTITAAKTIANLPPWLVERFGALFPVYFQEIFDPEMRDLPHTGRFEDRPAGFRLLYKHGRSQPSAWTLIHNRDEFIDALVDFFRATEATIVEETGLEEEIPAIVTEMIHHIRRPLFLEGAELRMQQRHGAKAKPWSYVSGGSMETLLTAYYGLEQPLDKRERCVESPLDLFLFLLEVMKELPPEIAQPFLDDPTRSLLMESPRHAFLFKPGLPPFSNGWLQDANTYTWVREYVIRPQQDFVANLRLTPPMLRHLGIAPSNSMALRELPNSPELARRLFGHLPYINWNELRSTLVRIFDELGVAVPLGELPMAEVFSAKEVQSLAQGLLLEHFQTPYASEDYAWQIRQIMRRLGLAYPAPILFADTNWNWDFFGFLVNPLTQELELWRSDYIGIEGAPMNEWAHWLDGSSEETWVVYPHFT